MIGTMGFIIPMLIFVYMIDQVTGNDFNGIEKREFTDSKAHFTQVRDAHSATMTIAFLVLFPLGSLAIYLPIEKIPGIRNSYLKNKVLAIHAPIQILATILMIAGLGTGVHIGYQLDYIEEKKHHVIIGFVVVGILLLQPFSGIVQHLYFRQTGRQSILGIVHKWVGRTAIILGIVNNAFGLQLVVPKYVGKSHYRRNFIFVGILCLIWLALVIHDTIKTAKANTKASNVQDGNISDPGSGEILEEKKSHSKD